MSPFPKGWFRVASSKDLAAGQTKALRYFGRDLVLFRGQSGEAHVLDAHCPHMGAHLGHGGTVSGERVVCPFHAWEFDASGKCAKIPYCQKIPAAAKTGSWPVREYHGQVMVYFSETSEQPAWECPVLPQQASGGWTDFELVRHWTKVRANVHEFSQNGLDMAHFPKVHAGLPIRQEGAPRFDGPFLRFDHRLNFPKTGTTGLAQQINAGLGLLIMDVGIEGKLPLEYNILFFFTPVEKELCEIYAVMSMKKGLNPLLSYFVKREVKKGTIANFSQDLKIFEHKIFDRFLLCEGDATVAQFQRWARQFQDQAIDVPCGP